MRNRKKERELAELKLKVRSLLAARHHERALPLLERLCEIEPEEPRWPQKLGDSQQRLGANGAAVAAYQVAARRYAELGFAIKAIALGKVILGLDPKHQKTQAEVAELCGSERPADLAAPAPVPVSEGMVRVETAEVAVVEPSDVVVAEPAEVCEPAEVVVSDAAIPISGGMVITDAGDFDPGAANPWSNSRARDALPPDPEVPSPAPPPVPRASRAPVPPLPVPPLPVPPQSIPLGESLDAIDLRQLVPKATAQVSSVQGIGASFEIPLGDIDAAFAALVPEQADGEERIAPEALPPTQLFSSLDRAALQALIERVTVRHHEPGEEILRQGEEGDGLFVVVEGDVSVSRDGVEVATLGEGAFFGEIALLTKLARSATVRATTECTLLEINRQLVGELIEQHPAVLTVMLRFFRERLVDTLVDTSELFAPFAGPDRLALAERFRLLEASPECSLVCAGEESNGLYILLTGQATATWPAGGSATLGTGELFGERSMLESSPSPVTVTTATKCWLLKLDRRTFREVIMTHPHVLAVLSDRAAREPAAPPATGPTEGPLEQRLPIL